ASREDEASWQEPISAEGVLPRRTLCPPRAVAERRGGGPADWESKPMVLLVGQYSTGKTTFIRHLLEQDFPGMRIGPEPTTDSFIAVMGGESEGVVPGNALVVDPRRPFRKLNAFGNAFLNSQWGIVSCLVQLLGGILEVF
uniref:Dynamin-type G domain-containing protein n=1 Tax=Laticauda laticaudata TaxID=8630 RepID=A0A8C5SFH2_LATLA